LSAETLAFRWLFFAEHGTEPKYVGQHRMDRTTGEKRYNRANSHLAKNPGRKTDRLRFSGKRRERRFICAGIMPSKLCEENQE